MFIEHFLCTAASSPLSAAPSNEKLKFWHAVSGAILEKTAYLLSAHFHRFINTYHTALFPHAILQFHLDYSLPNRRFRRGRAPRPASASEDNSVSDTVSSQRSASALPLPLHGSAAFNSEPSSLPPRVSVLPAALRVVAARSGLRPRVVQRDYLDMSQNGLV